ncbi:SGNH/GDSL hydrolase family protein [Nonomuraea sp. NEAU-A123]|uniref:SGNH/GDSL hydrolase family protein n=1 Tax=Nonomuraea sp. NEAU-A123 TaxID=2839649 RepID=UPI001BE482CE|nr:SGNH/GDSL hydrolase family protein [Nonomuraea sp. NEAU-A123]MBT2227542.1 SGNH/GDSL hydrolase family protein [Nonomuraea sp. NEAU-A123]
MITRLAPLCAAALVLLGSGTAHASSAEPVPEVMAALGDSVSAGFNACGWYVSCTSRSWSAGDNTQVTSHYLRLAGLSRSILGHNRNFAVPGSTSADLLGQVRQAVDAKASYVTILIGAQDACKPAEKDMTPVQVYRQRLDAALAELRAGIPGVRVLIASIPDLRRLWQVGKGNALARSFWTLGHICPTMLASPSSMKAADVARRTRVRARVMAYNQEAAEACATLGPACRTDGGAVFAYPFTLDHISKWDYFHPDADGQRVLAALTFKNGFEWIDVR